MTCASKDRVYSEGDTVEVTEAKAQEFIRANIAVAVQEPVAERAATNKPPSRATSWRKPN